MKLLRTLLINLLVFSILFLLVEVAIRIFRPELYLYKRSYPNETQNQNYTYANKSKSWCKPHSTLGWVLSTDSILLFGDSILNQNPVKYPINKQGFRNEFDFDTLEPNASQQRIMFIGDSFLASVYLEQQKSITHQVQKILGDSSLVINLGVPGYGIDQQVLSFKALDEVIKPDKVVLFYIDDDISRTLEAYRNGENMNKPSFRIEHGKLVSRHNDKRSVAVELCEQSYLLNYFYKNYMHYLSYQICVLLFDELITTLKKDNRELLVFRCPVSADVDNKQMEDYYSFSDFFASRGVTYVELLDDVLQEESSVSKNLFLPTDGHPNEFGAHFFAKKMAQRLVKQP